MFNVSNQQNLPSEQYQNSDKLRARIALYEHFSTNKEDFSRWMFSYIGAPVNAKVLELGCGPANLWVKNRERIPATWHITLSDLSTGMIEEAHDAVRGLPGTFELRVADAQTLPFDTESFDVVIANHMLFHVPDIERALAEVRRVLKPVGHFYTTTNGKAHLQELHAFVHEHLLKALEPECKMPSSAGRFKLEDAPAMLHPHFDEVKAQIYPNSLEVTDADALLASVLSWESWRDVSEPVGRERLEHVTREARKALERQLTKQSFHVTQSSGLLICS